MIPLAIAGAAILGVVALLVFGAIGMSRVGVRDPYGSVDNAGDEP